MTAVRFSHRPHDSRFSRIFQSRFFKRRAARSVIGLFAAVAVAFAAQSGEEVSGVSRIAETVIPPVVTTSHGTRAVEITVLTYNVKGLPWPFRLDLAEADAGTAMTAIGRHLAQLRAEGRAPNIVLIQEGFPDETARIGVLGGYRYAARGPNRDDANRALASDEEALAVEASWRHAETQGALLDSGLYAFSDFPLTVAQRRAFGRACAGYDCLAAKGVLALTVDIPGLPAPLNTLTLHMNASARTAGVSEPRAAAAHRLQMERFAEVLEHLDPAHPLIIAGDFNVKQDTGRQGFADARLGGAGLESVHVRCRAREAFCRPGYQTRMEAHWLEPRDIQTFRNGATVRVEPLSSDPMFAGPLTGGKMSDHVGYLVRYRLSWQPQLTHMADAR